MKPRRNFFSSLSTFTLKIRSLDVFSKPLGAAALLLAVTLASYALVAKHLGFYWDSWAMNWIAQTRGNAGLAQYFSTNRPVWGLLYQLSTPLLGGTPLPWQIFGIFWRWAAAVAMWGLLRLLWPRQPEPALWASLLFVIFPSFQQQSIEFLYSHFFIVISAFLGSLVCSLWAVRQPRWRWLALLLGLALSAVNLLMMEYFFMLELLRPVLFWFAWQEETPALKARLRRVLVAWLPYLALFLGAVAWRAFFFPYQTNNYEMISLSRILQQPLATAGLLAGRVVSELWIAVVQPWSRIIRLQDFELLGLSLALRYALIIAATGLVLFLAGWQLIPRRNANRAEELRHVRGGLVLAGAALLLAGWPFWLTSVPFSLSFAYDRFTLPFMLGACLLLASLLLSIPRNPARWLLLAVLVGFGTGFQYQQGLDYWQDWVNQQQFFWQLQWRVPNLKPGTIIFANENKVTAHSTDNSLSAPINWIYDPENHSQTINYLMIYPSIRLNDRNSLRLEKDTPVSEDFLIGKFAGNTSQSISIYYDGISCLRLLDPIIDSGNPIVPDELRMTASFSDTALIQLPAGGQSAGPPLPQIFGQPPSGSWCQIYEQADIMRHAGQWYNILQLWEKAKNLYSQSQSASEAVPFVEAFARTGQWDQAARLTINTQKTRPIFCFLWQQLDQSTPAGLEKKQAVNATYNLLRCGEYGIISSQP
jgi:hypothetical protein